MTTIRRLAITVAAGLAAAATLPQPNGGGFRLDGQAVRPGESTLAGAGFIPLGGTSLGDDLCGGNLC